MPTQVCMPVEMFCTVHLWIKSVKTQMVAFYPKVWPVCAASFSEAAAGPCAPPEDEGMDPVDPDFLAALPEELQQEVMESRRREIQQRRSAREREEAQRVRTPST